MPPLKRYPNHPEPPVAVVDEKLVEEAPTEEIEAPSTDATEAAAMDVD